MLAVLMLVGFSDLTMTAVLHAQGLIVELNPLMKPLIETNEWLFVLVKGMTLVGAWLVMARHAKINRSFVHKACIIGTAAYLIVFTTWFLAAL